MKHLSMKNQALPPVECGHITFSSPNSGWICGLWSVAKWLDLDSVIVIDIDKYINTKYRYTGGYQGNGEVQVGYR